MLFRVNVLLSAGQGRRRDHSIDACRLTALDERSGVCFYAFVRTTVDLPSDLVRRAKARAATRGESLKALFTRALSAELGRDPDSRTRGRVRLPLIAADAKAKPVAFTNEDLERVLADEDAQRVRSQRRRRREAS